MVTKDIPDFALAYGNPAIVKGYICKCGEKIEVKCNRSTCKKCKQEYVVIDDCLVEVNK